MDQQAFECLTNFTDLGDEELGVDVADNVPTWNHTYRATPLSVSCQPLPLPFFFFFFMV